MIDKRKERRKTVSELRGEKGENEKTVRGTEGRGRQGSLDKQVNEYEKKKVTR